jgi:hypothetical protein
MMLAGVRAALPCHNSAPRVSCGTPMRCAQQRGRVQATRKRALRHVQSVHEQAGAQASAALKDAPQRTRVS